MYVGESMVEISYVGIFLLTYHIFGCDYRTMLRSSEDIVLLAHIYDSSPLRLACCLSFLCAVFPLCV
jgi:hypothetical protein